MRVMTHSYEDHKHTMTICLDVHQDPFYTCVVNMYTKSIQANISARLKRHETSILEHKIIIQNHSQETGDKCET